MNEIQYVRICKRNYAKCKPSLRCDLIIAGICIVGWLLIVLSF